MNVLVTLLFDRLRNFRQKIISEIDYEMQLSNVSNTIFSVYVYYEKKSAGTLVAFSFDQFKSSKIIHSSFNFCWCVRRSNTNFHSN